MGDSIANLVKTLQLKEHPEGGYYREVYRSNLLIPEKELPEGFSGDRSCATAIYYLLPSDSFSAFHRIRQDEIWHFYLGSTVVLHIISAGGVYNKAMIGKNIEEGDFLQYAVPAGSWFAAEVIEDDSFSLVGCTVSPGFDFRDFELGSRADLIKRFPDQLELIGRLTRS